jgi:hypothetical protein
MLLVVMAALPVIALAASPPADIVDYFKMYYGQQVAKSGNAEPLEFLRDAAGNHASAGQVLKPGASRSVIVDRRNGYLQIADGSNTDQVLTMAIYSKADGERLIVAGTSDCADACDFTVGFFVPDDSGLKAVPSRPVIPAISPAEFIRAAHPMPKALIGLEPKINYVPARVGTALTLKPWYGYEVEEVMDAATRGAIQNVELRWDRRKGEFVISKTAPAPR